ncbi:hypothetical protein [Aminipila terrae]|uniref:Uncharacterized protein n=1 Tax=Aminipila terrae TaxID=2697030 RepID=A0A6P1MN72_9FIRM|nr:hypothetical protein [Aminipila terrae]QHI73548.1 hypothetical protein Ami3637_15230 [Aminipila terrae]
MYGIYQLQIIIKMMNAYIVKNLIWILISGDECYIDYFDGEYENENYIRAGNFKRK